MATSRHGPAVNASMSATFLSTLTHFPNHGVSYAETPFVGVRRSVNGGVLFKYMFMGSHFFFSVSPFSAMQNSWLYFPFVLPRFLLATQTVQTMSWFFFPPLLS
jgi:hypothetical protein